MTSRGGSTYLNSAVASVEEETAPTEYFRKDYEPLTNIVTKINMDFNIQDGKTIVTSEMKIEANPNGPGAGDLVLDGDETCVKLVSLEIDGKALSEGDDYTLSPGKLVIKKSALKEDGSGTLTSVVEIVPEENTQLSGKFYRYDCSNCFLFFIYFTWLMFDWKTRFVQVGTNVLYSM